MADINLSSMQLASVADSNCLSYMASRANSFAPLATTAKVIDLFGGLETFCKLPELPWQYSFHKGGTGYIDGVQSEDFPPSTAIMRGIDEWNRPFIAIKTCETGDGANKRFACDNFSTEACGLQQPKEMNFFFSNTEGYCNLKKPFAPAVDVLFQRYSNDESNWKSRKGDYGGGRLTSGTMNSKQIENLRTLLNTGKVEMANEDGESVIVHLTDK